MRSVAVAMAGAVDTARREWNRGVDFVRMIENVAKRASGHAARDDSFRAGAGVGRACWPASAPTLQALR